MSIYGRLPRIDVCVILYTSSTWDASPDECNFPWVQSPNPAHWIETTSMKGSWQHKVSTVD